MTGACRASDKPAVTPSAQADPSSASHAHVHALNERYAQDANIETWRARFHAASREVVARKADILAALGVQPGMTVADVGAGTGLFTFDLAAAVGAAGRVFAVEIQPMFLDTLREQATEHRPGAANVEVITATARSPNLPAGAVDLAFVCDVYHHLEQPEAYVAALFQAVRPGGRMVVVEFDRKPTSRHWVHDHVRANAATFRREIEASGFVFVRAHDVLQDNFMFEFQRPAPTR